MKPSQRYLQDSNLMMEFRNAYVELINHAHAAPTGLTLTVLKAAPGVSQSEWTRLYSEVSQAAGAAASAYPRYGGTFTLRNAAYIMHNVDPVANWQMSIQDPQQLEPTTIVSTVEAAISRSRQASVEAAERERGLTGLLAAFLRWPSNLREAVGPDHSAQRTAAGVIGIVGQILVGIVASLLAAGLVAGGVALWGTVF
ncbi:hypothetical protein [uncultured Modestobacter sp.]|uniref:hypothetical protein n=1 Tax=uncultured Modestobacter sp. TaxID=380048 RepID=UPI002636BD35|nr:hypothetical protein [uncultured Modestobacter sp.]